MITRIAFNGISVMERSIWILTLHFVEEFGETKMDSTAIMDIECFLEMLLCLLILTAVHSTFLVRVLHSTEIHTELSIKGMECTIIRLDGQCASIMQIRVMHLVEGVVTPRAPEIQDPVVSMGFSQSDQLLQCLMTRFLMECGECT